MKEKLKNKFLGINEISDNKEKSIIMMLFWTVFIVGVIFYINANTPAKEQQNVIVFDSISDIFSVYKSYNYDISIKDIDGNKVSYKGKYEEGIDTGKKIKGEEVINYKIDSESIINTDNEEVIEDLYEDYLSYFFTPSNIYNYLSFLSAKEKEDGDIKIYNYEYVYDDKDITFDITTTVNRIEEIVITYDNHIYNIKFSL